MPSRNSTNRQPPEPEVRWYGGDRVEVDGRRGEILLVNPTRERARVRFDDDLSTAWLRIDRLTPIGGE